MAHLDSVLKSREYHFVNKGPYSKSYGLYSSHVWMWELDHKEAWAAKNWCFPIVVLEKILENHLHSKEIKPVTPKGNQPWIFIGRTDTEAEVATWCKVPNHWERSWCWERLKVGGEGGKTESEIGWHHHSMNLSLSKLQEIVKDREAWSMGSERVGYYLVTEQQ